ncbi:hypothetical protein FQR65_LT16264 [Abscondita terminalis]|nr:hypothetical protein FQR65_LT16264 [Abscondita terminalis]
MYALVKFTEDNVYHVCNAASVRICFDDVQAKWTNGRFYSAKVIVQHANKHLLNELKQNLECNRPIVVLSSNFNNLSYPQHNREAICGLTNDLVESGSVSHSDIYAQPDSELNEAYIDNTENTTNVEAIWGLSNDLVESDSVSHSDIYAQPDSELNEAYIDNTENTANVEAIWGLSNGLVETESVSHSVIYAQPHSELNEASIDYTADTTNIEPNVVESGILADVEIEFIDYLPNGDGILHLNSSIDSQCSLVVSTPSEISKGNEVQYHTEDHSFDLSFENPGFEKDNSFLVEENQQHFQNNAGIVLENIEFNGGFQNENNTTLEGHNSFSVQEKQHFQNNAENVPEEKNQNRSQQNKKRSFPPYNREVVLTPSVTERTLQDGSTVAVSSATETKRRYFCIYCKQLYAKFPQHLQISHRDEPAVKMFMQLPPRNRERKRIIETIRRRGDFQHNVSAEYNSGELLVARRSHSDFLRSGKDYLPCPYCSAFFRKDTLRLHTKNCTPKTSNSVRTVRVLSRTLLAEIHPRASDMLKMKIFPILRDNDCVQIIRYDVLAILFGNHLCSKYSSQHHHDMIRNKLRSIGRLLIAVKRYDAAVKDFANLLTPTKFDVCVRAIKDVGGLNSNCSTFKAPTTVLTLSTICKQAAEVWKAECIKNNDVLGKRCTEDFLTLFKVTFPAELANTAIENRVQQQRQKVVKLPLKDDIKQLVAFLRRNRREWFLKVRNETSNLNYALRQLASFTLVSLMVFNRRRPGELERITIKDFSVLKFIDSASSLTGHLKNPEDIRVAKKYKRFEIRGKLNRSVPVLVEFETEACINLIIDKREKAGISPANPYVFACTSNDDRHKHLRAYFLLRKYANLCGAKEPGLLRATQLRKHIATECALNDLADNQIRDVANFMGHAIDIHNNIYRRPVEKRDVLQMSQILEEVQGDREQIDEDDSELNDSSQFANVLRNQQSLETNERDEQLSDESSEIEDCNLPLDSDCEDYTPKQKKKRKHGEGLTRICGLKTPWTKREKLAVIKNFEEYIREDRLPSMEQLLVKLAVLKELKHRSPTSVRSCIHNELQRKRNSSSYKDKETVRNRWTESMKMELTTVFCDHFEDNTLPSNAECAIAIENCREFQHLTVAALKTAVANEQKRRSKNKAASAQLSKLWRKKL